MVTACVILLAIPAPEKVSDIQVDDSTYSTAHIKWDKDENSWIAKTVFKDRGKINYYKNIRKLPKS